MAKYKVQTVTATFGGTAMKVKKIPVGRGQSSDPVDVTCLDEEEEKFLPGALIKNKEFQVVAQGITEAPAINTVGDIVIVANYNDGTANTQKTVTIPNCILKDIDPPEPEAGGDRAANWTLTFQPGGGSSSTPAAGSGSDGASGGSDGASDGASGGGNT